LEVQYPIGIQSPKGLDLSWLSVLRGSDPLCVLVFPFAEAMGNLYSVKTFLRRPFPKAFPSTTPRGSFWRGVRDESKGQILWCLIVVQEQKLEHP
jgi:hypothetical protein